MSEKKKLEAYYGLPEEVAFCSKCVMSNQRPTSAVEFKHTKESKKTTMNFDEEGVCDVERDREELTEEEVASGCYFRAQADAYRNPGSFKYDFLRSLGEVEIKGYQDGITRFLMGPKFTKRSEADKLRMKCIASGEWDSWIIVRR